MGSAIGYPKARIIRPVGTTHLMGLHMGRPMGATCGTQTYDTHMGSMSPHVGDPTASTPPRNHNEQGARTLVGRWSKAY